MGREARLKKRLRPQQRSLARREAVAAEKVVKGCPDFDLAPLERFPPEVFASKDYNPVDAFILTLALAFNDMKGVQWFIVQLDKCKPEETGIGPKVGEWYGMKLQATRLTLLVLHELLIAIKTATADRVLDDECFAESLSRLGRRSSRGWAELISLSKDTPGDSEVRKYIERVRHNFAAHYYQPKALFQGYQRFFFERATDQFNENALVSLGAKVGSTRFYFADAAVQTGQKLLDRSDELLKEVHNYVLTMFQALRNLIEAYLTVKAELLRFKA